MNKCSSLNGKQSLVAAAFCFYSRLFFGACQYYFEILYNFFVESYTICVVLHKEPIQDMRYEREKQRIGLTK